MWNQRFKTGILLTTAAACVLGATACGPSQPQNPSSSSGSPATSSPAATPSSSSPPASSSSAAPGLCKSASLTGSIDTTGGGAAGSINGKLILTNSGTAPCILKGYPGVSLVAEAEGAPIGAPATRDEAQPATEILLTPGSSGAAPLRYTQAGLYLDCAHVPAAGYRIYPPEDTASLFIVRAQEACSNDVIKLLSIGAFQPV